MNLLSSKDVIDEFEDGTIIVNYEDRFKTMVVGDQIKYKDELRIIKEIKMGKKRLMLLFKD